MIGYIEESGRTLATLVGRCTETALPRYAPTPKHSRVGQGGFALFKKTPPTDVGGFESCVLPN